MVDLPFKDRRRLETLFAMDSGYVLNFSDRTFGDFVQESTGKDLYDEARTYCGDGTSKAKRLRAFWKLEPEHLVGKLVHDLVAYARETFGVKDPALHNDCQRIADRLRGGAVVAELAALTPNAPDPDFDTVAQEARAAIDGNKPEAGLGHLHTFMVWFVRSLCTARGITFAKDTALHALFGQYLKNIRAAGLIESDMTDRITRSFISTLEAFNDVRNNQSLAHANSILNSDEALFIYNHVCSTVRFLQALERKHVKPAVAAVQQSWRRPS